ncbi:3-oxoacyl-[acyl-carrier protein] reductase [Chitinasiproducens palmae]|uniref:3-oxoacyl-[acyl-carrier protein] reductase n=1 Tax=Chitinasiproducens palmae TaxID=1770053 RepID=A0A1H2PTF1_9BURK|nr:3-oxoacyl-[acyl-carrier protein] reductase [Chitinasiproducens palmae]
MRVDLRGRVALVTGAARGIGFAIAERLGANGARVVVADLNAAQAEAARDRLVAAGIEAMALGADVSDERDVAEMVGCAERSYGAVDILVNNAGMVSTTQVTDTTSADWRRVMAVNLDGVFYCIRAALPGMVARGYGRIVNISSVAGKRGGGLLGGSCYAASKGGVIALTKGVAREAGPFGVTVNAITPALIDTEMTSILPPAGRARVLADMPVGRAGTPADIAAAACFLASDAAAFITGEIMDVDGGFMRD